MNAAEAAEAKAKANEPLTYDEFQAELRDLSAWLSRHPRMRTAWWLAVEEFAAKRFNEAYRAQYG